VSRPGRETNFGTTRVSTTRTELMRRASMTLDMAVLRPISADDSVDLAVRRLSDEFRDRLGAQYVRRIVQLARADLSGVPAGAVPELVERLARHRLTHAA
jgi:hypothetical protein